AIIAPSFPAEFSDIDPPTLIGMLRKLGFGKVAEVSFGADLVSLRCKQFVQNADATPTISSDCPAIVSFIEYYHPELTKNLLPVVSPMVAMTRVMKKKYGNDLIVVFIGPCIAKKEETDELDAVITYRELREIFSIRGVTSESVQPSSFDPPYSGKGALFPVSRGMLQAMDIDEDLVNGNIIVAEGRTAFQEAIKEFESGYLEKMHLELLCCDGCILGPGMSPYSYNTSPAKRYAKRIRVSKYVAAKMKNFDPIRWQTEMDEFKNIDLTRNFIPKHRMMARPSQQEVEIVLRRLGKFSSKDYLDCSACGYETCYDHAVAIINGLAEIEMCLPYTIEKLHNYIRELNVSKEKLASTQQALKQSEKLASLGQLSAGIAHELNNPLGVITMYSSILKDELQDHKQVTDDLALIAEQADRCRKIVSGLLNFARKNQVNFKDTDLNQLIRSSITSVIVPSDVKIQVEYLADEPMAMVDKDQMTQVFSNLLKNSIDAMPKGGKINISMMANGNDVLFEFSDTGIGIAKENMPKLFTPFFTTKAIGKGTGLGLPIIYGIVKMHKGDITVTSNADPLKKPTGTTFRIRLPRHRIE
ncbi:MAG TPA: [Fe-Fe] hydrogenase large subunit C-terminal domain-containing protein, partial [Bacteroidales bacterium]|nr:[Fe-Fe] hydrogenase large subunit C-terminal domain-containing protein [Bacteroidales bacterium]